MDEVKKDIADRIKEKTEELNQLIRIAKENGLDVSIFQNNMFSIKLENDENYHMCRAWVTERIEY
ncbi:MAG TPA: hypothetical protein DCX45_03475 [Acinetobacter junii]|nr:hypothetical protein [Acinetobacter junii]